MLSIICDNKFFNDYTHDAPKSKATWDATPRYLLGRLISSPYFEHKVEILPYEITHLDKCLSWLNDSSFGIIHIDASILPNKAQTIKQTLPGDFLLINRKISNIRKSILNGLLRAHGQMTLDIDSDIKADTLVFLKSDYNAGDAPNRIYRKCHYRELPISALTDRSLIVQKFVSEKLTKETEYCRLRRFIVVGREIVQVEYFSQNSVIKRSHSSWQYSRDIKHLKSDIKEFGTPNISMLGYAFHDFCQEIGPGFHAMVGFLEKIGLDFGTVDVITPSYDEFYILDVNYTPWERGIPESLVRILSKTLSKMAEG